MKNSSAWYRIPRIFPARLQNCTDSRSNFKGRFSLIQHGGMKKKKKKKKGKKKRTKKKEKKKKAELG